ncbi:MAG: hypothetical protein ACR2IM_04865 [Sediminibacterium sp.]
MFKVIVVIVYLMHIRYCAVIAPFVINRDDNHKAVVSVMEGNFLYDHLKMGGYNQPLFQ